ncbi:MAG: hypothetical protein H6595_11980 [Flavobacteriales bacterium]|nr:hypothetical protein [Flavobacteriales bacterium]MCB9168180.1 hypothetical protein [Flavobacteriales bacterium]
MDERPLPLSRAAEVLGILSVPLAFLAQLVVPAAIMALLAVFVALWGRGRYHREPMRYAKASWTRMRRGLWAGTIGLVTCTVLWVLYGMGLLPF